VDLRVVGRLEDSWVPASDFVITPVVAVAARAPLLIADPSEVARILRPRLATFLQLGDVAVVERSTADRRIRYGHFEVDGLSVWGATARILGQLGALLSTD
jgi:hypothetical protein